MPVGGLSDAPASQSPKVLSLSPHGLSSLSPRVRAALVPGVLLAAPCFPVCHSASVSPQPEQGRTLSGETEGYTVTFMGPRHFHLRGLIHPQKSIKNYIL